MLSTMARPRIHDASTGAQLLTNAEALLAEGGPDAVSVRAVADRSATTTRAVYAVFGSKEGLVRHLCRSGYDLLSGAVEGLPETDDPAADLVACGIDGFRAFATQRPHLFRLTFERVTSDLLEDADVRQSAERAYDALARRADRVIEHHQLRQDSAEVVLQFHSLCQGLATSELQAQPPPVGSGFWPMLRGADMEALWRSALRAYVSGLAVPRPTPARP
jgi:AcrR family transcriptional regulator